MGKQALAAEAEGKDSQAKHPYSLHAGHEEGCSHEAKADSQGVGAEREVVNAAAGPEHHQAAGKRAERVDLAIAAVRECKQLADGAAEEGDEEGLAEAGEEGQQEAESQQPGKPLDELAVGHASWASEKSRLVKDFEIALSGG